MAPSQKKYRNSAKGGGSCEETEGIVIRQLAELFAAIGNPIRLMTLYALREQDDNSMKWQEIQKMIGTTGGSLKFHMDKLGAFNLVENYGGKYRITTKGIGLLYLVDELKEKVEKIVRIELETFS
jgi:predicted transcriptional regulator